MRGVKRTRIMKNEENQVNAETARRLLAAPGKPWGRNRIGAIKHLMGIKGRYFFLSDVRKWLREHPDFRQADVYKSKPSPKRQVRPQGPPISVVDTSDELLSTHGR